MRHKELCIISTLWLHADSAKYSFPKTENKLYFFSFPTCGLILTGNEDRCCTADIISGRYTLPDTVLGADCAGCGVPTLKARNVAPVVRSLLHRVSKETMIIQLVVAMGGVYKGQVQCID